jgi:hypothetical protein
MPPPKFTAPSPKAVVGKAVLGYCRKSLKEYLNILDISLSSCGELHSCYDSCYQPVKLTKRIIKKSLLSKIDFSPQSHRGHREIFFYLAGDTAK